MITQMMRRLFSDARYCLGALCVACILAYANGLGGDFLFDDFQNIVDNPALQAITRGTTDWLNVAFLTGSGVLRRPISMLSFGLNVTAFGMDPFAFKLVNLAIHLANGLLLYALFRRIVARLFVAEQEASAARAIALIACAAWLLHPLQVSSVLYVVQRMNQLATLFTLLGLLCYAEGRLCMLRGERGLAAAIAGTCAFGLLGALSKENGALTVAYALLIEFTCFRFDAAPRERRSLQAFFWLVVALPIALFTLYLALHPAYLSYSRNGFTLSTRLLSEARVLCDYLVWIFVPLPAFMSMFHDDIKVSGGLFTPPTTALSIAFLIALVVVAWRLRRRFPALAFGVGWFLLGQSMESTIFPLELVFEHRNYLPMAGPLLAATCLLASASTAEGWKASGFAITSAIAIMLLTGATALRAADWGSALSLALSDAAHHPLSSRSQYSAGRAIAVDGAKRGDPKGATLQALPYLKRAAELDRSQVHPAVSLILLRATDQPASAEEVADLARRVRNASSHEQANAFLDLLVSASEGSVSLDAADVSRLVEAALANPVWPPQTRAMIFNDYGAYLFNVVRDVQGAIRLTLAAAAEEPTNPYFELNLVKIALAVGQTDVARVHLANARRLNKVGLYDAEIAELQSRIGR